MNAQETLGPYRLVKKLGRGGMAEVWEAVHSQTGASIALKVMDPEDPEREEISIRRFRDEVAVGLLLNHPNLVRVLDEGSSQGRAYFAMELLEGATLAQLMRRTSQSIPVETALAIVEQILAGLEYAHHKMVHRDLKPSNVFLCVDGRIKILDYGIALVKDFDQTQTRTGAVRGSLPYCSPEQLRGQKADVRSDLWSTGLILYELLSGEPCFSGNEGAIVSAVMFAPVPPIRMKRSEVPQEVEAFLENLLRKDPQERFGSASSALEQLRRVMDGADKSRVSLQAWAHEALSSQRSGTATVRRFPVPAPKAPPVPVPRLRRWPWAVAFLVVGALVIAGVQLGIRPPPAAEHVRSATPQSTPATVNEVATEQPKPVVAVPSPQAARRKKATGWLTVGVKSGWAQISINGAEKGPTPLFRVVLPEGTHVVEAKLPTGVTLRERAVVHPNRETTLSFQPRDVPTVTNP